MATYYISPTGSPSNSGTLASPWSFAHVATGAGGVLTSGDIVRIQSGSYALGSAPDRNLTITSACAGVTFQGSSPLPWQMPVLRGGLIIEAQGSVWRDFRMTWDYDSLRVATTFPVNSTDVPRINATFKPLARDIVKINVIVHDLAGGFDAFSQSPGFQSHDSIVYNNGWQGLLRGSGHGFYMQSAATPNLPADRKIVTNLISFCNYGSNGKLGGTDEVSNLIGFRYSGCTFFDPGLPVMPTFDPEPNFICDGASTRKGHIDLWNCSLWMRDGGFYDYSVAGAPLSLWLGDVNEGASPVTLQNSLIQGRVRMGNWVSATVTNNAIGMGDDQLPWTLGRAMVQLDPTPSPYSKYTWNNNRYAHAGDARIMLPASVMQNLVSWQSTTGYDAASTHTVGEFTTTDIQFVRSAVDGNRATATIWNYSGASSVSLDVSRFLAPGDTYSIYHVYDWVTTGTPTLSGQYTGGNLSIPMTTKTPPTPQGDSALPNLPNTFGVFILRRDSVALRTGEGMIARSRIAATRIAASEPAPTPPSTPVSGRLKRIFYYFLRRRR